MVQQLTSDGLARSRSLQATSCVQVWQHAHVLGSCLCWQARMLHPCGRT